MPSGNGRTDLSKARLDHAASDVKPTIVAVPRDQWTHNQSQNTGAIPYNPVDMWMYGDQGASGPYHAIGAVEATYANSEYGDSHGNSAGYTTSTVATQGSAKSKAHEGKHPKKSHKSSSKKKVASKQK